MLDARRIAFLTAVLGRDGAKALQKAAERSTELGNALVPRTILAWLGTTHEYDGELPGLEKTHITFSKSEDGYSGAVTIADDTYRFEKASLFHLAASVAVAIGVKEESIGDGLRDFDVERLGKSIDLLAKAKMVGRELAKVSPPGKFKDLPEKLKDKGYSADSAFAIAWSQHNKTKKDEIEPGKGKKLRCSKCDADIYQTKDGKVGFHSHEGKKCSGSGKEPTLEKKDMGPGPSAAPTAPAAPTPPTSTAPVAPAPKAQIQKPKIPKPAKPQASYTLKVTKAERDRACPACGGHNFNGVYFLGCMCFKDLAKFAKAEATEGGFLLTLGTEWDREAIVTFLESLGRS